jgi:hypothetical protein
MTASDAATGSVRAIVTATVSVSVGIRVVG